MRRGEAAEQCTVHTRKPVCVRQARHAVSAQQPPPRSKQMCGNVKTAADRALASCRVRAVRRCSLPAPQRPPAAAASTAVPLRNHTSAACCSCGVRATGAAAQRRRVQPCDAGVKHGPRRRSTSAASGSRSVRATTLQSRAVLCCNGQLRAQARNARLDAERGVVAAHILRRFCLHVRAAGGAICVCSTASDVAVCSALRACGLVRPQWR